MTKQIRKYFIFFVLFGVLFICIILVESSIAGMYKWVDQNGVVHISDTPPQNVDNSKIETLPTYKADENNSTENRDNRSNTADSMQQNPSVKESKVELYITSWCSWSKKAKAFFRSRGIPLRKIKELQAVKSNLMAKKVCLLL